MTLVKTRYACLTAIFVIALVGLVETTRADVFTTDNFSGTIQLNSAFILPKTAATPASESIFSLNYTGTTTFDQTAVNALGNSNFPQVFNNFIKDDGSVSLTLFTPFGNYSFSSSSITPGSSEPTLVVWNEKAVGFDFNMKDTVGPITLDLNINAPLSTRKPNTPPSGTSYNGLLEDITLTATIEGFKGVVSATAITKPRFTVIPEPSTMLLLGLGVPMILTLLPRRQRMCS